MFCTAGFHATSQNRLIYIVIINTVFVNENEDESIEAKPLIDNFPIWLLRIVFPHLPPPPTPNFKTWRQIQSRSQTLWKMSFTYWLASKWPGIYVVWKPVFCGIFTWPLCYSSWDFSNTSTCLSFIATFVNWTFGR